MELTVLKNIVRTGWVSSVNNTDRTARVTFKDKGQDLVSGPLKVLKNPPFVEVEKTTLAYGVEEAEGHTHEGITESHTHSVTICPWLPSPGDFVLCIFLPNGDGDGFVIGGI